MKLFFLTAILTISTATFSCPGSTGITINSPSTQIEGDKVKGYLNVTTTTNSQTDKYSINLKEYAEGDLPVAFAFPANEQGDEIIFKVVDENEGEGKYIVYQVIYKGETDRIDPQMIARSVSGCGYEKEIE